MATLDLTLNSFEVPALSEYIPPFGHKKQKDGLSTQEVNNNIMMPFLKMRPTIVTENSVTTRIEYDAKLVFFANLQNAVNLDLEKASYIGCEILIYNLSAHACTVNKNTWNYTVPAGGYIKLKWNGSAWSQGVSSAVQAAIRDAMPDLENFVKEYMQLGELEPFTINVGKNNVVTVPQDGFIFVNLDVSAYASSGIKYAVYVNDIPFQVGSADNTVSYGNYAGSATIPVCKGDHIYIYSNNGSKSGLSSYARFYVNRESIS